MITYKVKAGDNLSTLAYKYQTTVDIIMADNPIIKNKNLIQVGWSLKIQTAAEYAKAKAVATTSSQKKATSVASAAKKSTPTVNTSSASQTSLGSPTGTITVTDATNSFANLYKITNVSKDKNTGNVQKIRHLVKNEQFKTYGLMKGGVFTAGMYIVGVNEYVDSKYVSFKQNPNAVGTITNNKPTQATPENITPKIAQFEKPDYRRPVLQVKTNSGKTANMELRIFSVSAGYSSSIQTNRTNGGWLINVSGENIPILTVSGTFLDTKTNKEFDDFMYRYRNYIQSYKTGNYNSMAICTFYYKNTQYKGLVASFNYSDTTEQELTKSFSMQYMVLSEKALSTAEIKAIPDFFKRGSTSSEIWLSDITNMLANPINGVTVKNTQD